MLNRCDAIALACVALLACGTTGVDLSHATQTNPDVVVAPSQTAATIRVGQTLSIPKPFDAENWSVDYSADVLELLNPTQANRPGPDGWRFRGVTQGETDVALTEITTGSPGAPPAPRRFVITVRVTL